MIDTWLMGKRMQSIPYSLGELREEVKEELS